MPISFRFIRAENLVVCVHTGTVKDKEFTASYKALFKDDRFDTSMNMLVDLQQTDSSQRSSAVLQEFVNFARTQYQDIKSRPRIAVIAPIAVSFGLARMTEAFSHLVPWDFMVFYSKDAALEWLGVADNLINDLSKDCQQ